MLEDLGAIQSRISEIQERIASLRQNTTLETPPMTTGTGAPTMAFDEALQRAQTPEATAPSPATHTGETVSGVYVPSASLGPLPTTTGATAPMPVVTGTAQYAGLIQTYAAKHGLDPKLVRAVIQTESGGNPRAISPAGAMGLMQLMPANVHEAGISDGLDPEQNIAAGTQQLSDLLKEYGGDLDLALAGYNAGPGNVRKYGGVPPFRETQNYIRKVRAAMGPDGE